MVIDTKIVLKWEPVDKMSLAFLWLTFFSWEQISFSELLSDGSLKFAFKILVKKKSLTSGNETKTLSHVLVSMA